MPTPFSPTAAVVGSGPNGLSAAVTLLEAGIPVTVFEASPLPGGGMRSSDSMFPGVIHDHCSAIHPLALATGFFKEFEITSRVRFVTPEASFANPLDHSDHRGIKRSKVPAAIAYQDLDRTCEELGKDGRQYYKFFRPILDRLEDILDVPFGGATARIPKSLPAAALLGFRALEQGTKTWNMRFKEEAAPALLTGVAAHAVGPMPTLATSAVGVVLSALGHSYGWPVPSGGSQSIADALIAQVASSGGVIETNHFVSSAEELRSFDLVFFDTSVPSFLQTAGQFLPTGYKRRLARFRHGDGAAKVDFVLDGPVPWQDERVHLTSTVHLGGTRAECALAEQLVRDGKHPEAPFVLLTQPSSFDPLRAPAPFVSVSAYTHVPRGSNVDVTRTVTNQIERFAPGFKDRIVATHGTTAEELSSYNPNYGGGDFNVGAVTLRQALARPVLSLTPWRTPIPGWYLCSSATAPGPGVHGLSGWYAAKSALRTI